MMKLFRQFGVRPTLFATHPNEAVQRCEREGEAQVGVHPNFLPNSTHGSSPDEVIEHITGLFPNAEVFRSHSFFDNSYISEAFRKIGYRYDSNLCLYLEEDIRPLRHSSGMLRFPVFWEDDVHWVRTNGDWSIDNFLDSFLSPGLKIINVHPIHIALNTPDAAFYKAVPKRAGDLQARDIEALRNSGPGTRSFLTSLLEVLTTQGHRFYTLAELFTMFRGETSVKNTASGRSSKLTAEDHANYWSSDNVDRQQSLKLIYDERNPIDPYATSRDGNQRELEIEAIRRALKNCSSGRLVDLGCGNGYTLISLARSLENWILEGIDFSEALIGGAAKLVEQNRADLLSLPSFLCADAVAHVQGLPQHSVDAFLTERFLLNLPSVEAQKDVIRDIHRALKPGGLLLMCEGSGAGFRELNRLRSAMGLAPTLETSADNISALRFEDAEIENFTCGELNFELIDKLGFSAFFTISRVLHPVLVAPQAPKFDAKINSLARDIQVQLPFQPGVGSNVLWILRKPTTAMT
jgi:SAM-dependent methyltransferase